MGNVCSCVPDRKDSQKEKTRLRLQELAQQVLDSETHGQPNTNSDLPDPQSIFFDPAQYAKYQPFLSKLASQKKKFLDTSFNMEFFLEEKVRMSDLYPSYKMHQNSIRPEEVTLGPFGQFSSSRSMYYLGVIIQALARKQRVKSYILTKNNNFGFHVVRLILNGIPYQIYLDDYILVSRNQPVHIRPQGQNIWPLIIQKAWAKVSIYNYKGDLSTSFQHLIEQIMGCPSIFFPISVNINVEKFVQSLHPEDQMFISEKPNSSGHRWTFSVSQVIKHELGVLMDKQEWVLKCFSPFSQVHQKSLTRSSMHIPLLATAFKIPEDQIVKYNIFAVSYISRHFDSIYIGCHRSKYHMTSLAMTGERLYSKFNITQSTEACIRFIQHFKEYVEGVYEYSSADLQIYRCGSTEETQYQLAVGQSMSKKGDKSLNMFSRIFLRLQPDEYLISSRFNWNYKIDMYSVNILAERPIKISAVSNEEAISKLRKLHLAILKLQPAVSNQKGIVLKRGWLRTKGFVYLFNSTANPIRFTVTLKDCSNVLLIGQTNISLQGDFKRELYLQPYKQEIFIYDQNSIKKNAVIADIKIEID